MTLTIGSVIKQLRTAHHATQETLAAALDVSAQAVSRWESGYCYPDIELLPAIADFFAVSIDELLGYRPDEREANLIALRREADRIAETGSVDEQINHARRALVSYPFDTELKLHLATALYFRWEETQDESAADECETLCLSVLETCRDAELRCDAVSTLTVLYRDQKQPDRALALINATLSPLKCCRELLLAQGIGDGKTALHIQNTINRLTDALGNAIHALVLHNDLPNDPSTWDNKIAMLTASANLYATIYGDDPLFYHCRLAKTHWLISTYRIAQGKADAALDSLEYMLHHTLAYDNARANRHGDPYTSIFTDRLIYSYPSKDCHELIEHNDAYYMLDRLTHRRYDPIRTHPRFTAVIDALEKDAE